MHKQDMTFHHSIAHRKGFALILTLSALTVIIALTAVLVSYLDEARKEATSAKALIQADLYYTDVKKLFSGFKEKKALYSVLYLSPVPLVSPDGRFSVIVKCDPAVNAVNINWLALYDDVNMTTQYNASREVFEFVIQEYTLEDAALLEEMLLEEIGGKNSYVLKEQSRLRQKNGIISYKQFTGILDRYQRIADDSHIGEVPWEKLFVFQKSNKDPEENLIDGNYMSAELISILSGMDLETVKDDWVKGALKLKTFVKDFGGSYDDKLYAKDFLDQSKCEVQYDYEGERFRFTFEDIEGEVKNFEFFGKQ